jgi:pantoate kinase
MTPEAKVKSVVTNTLKQMKAYIVKPMGVGYGNSGVPDLIV